MTKTENRRDYKGELEVAEKKNVEYEGIIKELQERLIKLEETRQGEIRALQRELSICRENGKRIFGILE